MKHSGNHAPSCPSDLLLDRLWAEELLEPEHASVRAHVDGCPECQRREQTQRQLAIQFLERAPRLELLAGARHEPSGRRTRPGSQLARRAGALLAAVTFAAGAYAALLWTQSGTNTDELPLRERSKGGLVLRYYVKRGTRIFEGAPRDTLNPGDAIQFGIKTQRSAFVAVFSVDGSGAASVYFPQSHEAARVPAGDTLVPQSTVLDEVLGNEWLIAVSCASAFEVEPIRERLAQHGDPDLQIPGCEVDRLLVNKAKP